MPVKVKIKINKLEWETLSSLLRKTMELCPLESWNLETYVLSDLYLKKMAFFTFYPYTKKGVSISFSMAQAIAMNQYFGATSTDYNVSLRLKIEPKLIVDVHKQK